ncbi:MAG: RNA polymerase sigma factor [Phycisphaerales bacterium]|nr:sigma-70 family RNA polymerase sigma factor [Planctomycetota bacterium]MCZ6612254.1 sigma-70 family RNA polymerase sigma factor [Planctomycetota bacterium]MCZ6736308.1 sigma-70 family RNA polymerase sigma factor [Planctomycetota bacterium]MCZ6811776.1 sigma-70 family RNA polymerase sigma factor [Planctomycetota bacterium]MCZ6852003.1 sigma-70 family RNA polymerase sigma factor [Planctomycetota bacterium]
MASIPPLNPAVHSQPATRNMQIAGDAAAQPAMSGVTSDPDGIGTADLTAAQAGDHQAFGRLYDRHAAVVLSLCRRFSLPEAEDATQETFIRAYRLLHKVQSPDKLRPWLYAIARRVCSERARSAQRRARHEEQLVLTQPAQSIAATAPEQADRAEQLQRLDDALDRLDDRERLAVHLYYLDADPVNAAASALGLSRSGYYKLLARAREHLADLMK